MKSPSHLSFPPRRHAFGVATLAILCGTTLAIAQSGGAGASSYGSTPKTPPADTSSSSSTAGAGAMTGRETTSHKLGWGDHRFVTKAAEEGQAEVQIAELAAQRASNSEVRNFAQKLVDDHSSVNSELTTLASQKNVKLDNDADKDRAYKRLTKKSGLEFDQEFVEHMIDEHEKDIKMFEKAAKEAKDPDIRSFASKHVDHLRNHLQQAQSLRATVMPTGRMDDSSGRSTPAGPTSTDTTTPSTTPDKSSSSDATTPSATPPKPDGSR